MLSKGAFSRAVEQLYSAALDASAWPDFLALAADLTSADNAYVSRIEHAYRTLDYVVLRPSNWDAVSVERYAALMDDDPRIAAFRGHPGRALHCGTAVSRRRLYASRTYQEALKPLDIEHTLLVNLPEPDGATNNYLGLTRGLSGAPFDVAETRLLDELAPHLARAFALRNLVRDGHRQQDLLRNVLARLPHAAFVVTSSGRVRLLNDAAHALSVAGLGLRVVDGRLQADGRAEQDQLRCALAAGAGSTTPRTLVLMSSDPRASLAVTIDPSMPVTADPLLRAADERLIFLSVETMWRRASSDADRLRGLFGLSPAQTRLTLLLMSGRSVKEAAATLGITEGSARQYIKIIFSKTGAKRQSDLILMIGSALSEDEWNS